MPDVTLLLSSSLQAPDVSSYIHKKRWGLHLYHSPCKLVIADTAYTIEPGCISLTPSDTPSHYTTKETLHYYCAHFIENNSPAEHIKKTYQLPYVLQLDTKYDYISNNFKEAISNSSIDPLTSAVKIWDILLTLSSITQNKQYTNQSQRITGIIISQINQHTSKIFTLKDFADFTGYTPVHLNRIFRKSTGMTVMQYQKQHIMNRAKYLLLYTSKSIKEITFELGIYDLSAFNKLFHKHFGHSPRTLRNI
jgi:AraC-like DNA-binding protein